MDENKTESLEDLYTKIHEAIRKEPERPKKQKKDVKKPKLIKTEFLNQNIYETSKGKFRKDRRLTNEERKDRVKQKIEIHTQMLAQAE